MIPLSSDERRIVVWLQQRAEVYEEAAQANPFSLHRVRANLCRKLSGAISDGKHR